VPFFRKHETSICQASGKTGHNIKNYVHEKVQSRRAVITEWICWICIQLESGPFFLSFFTFSFFLQVKMDIIVLALGHAITLQEPQQKAQQEQHDS
jgi:hypothetical protein